MTEPEPSQPKALDKKKPMHPALVVVLALAAVAGSAVVAGLGLLGLVAYTCSR